MNKSTFFFSIYVLFIRNLLFFFWFWNKYVGRYIYGLGGHFNFGRVKHEFFEPKYSNSIYYYIIKKKKKKSKGVTPIDLF